MTEAPLSRVASSLPSTTLLLLKEPILLPERGSVNLGHSYKVPGPRQTANISLTTVHSTAGSR